MSHHDAVIEEYIPFSGLLSNTHLFSFFCLSPQQAALFQRPNLQRSRFTVALWNINLTILLRLAVPREKVVPYTFEECFASCRLNVDNAHIVNACSATIAFRQTVRLTRSIYFRDVNKNTTEAVRCFRLRLPVYPASQLLQTYRTA